MIENGLPAPLNITLIAGQEKVIEMQVSTQDGAFKDMSYYTYAGEAQGVDGKKYVIEAWVEADSPDVVLVRLPALGEGRYRWYVTTYTEDGVAGALVSGTLGVQWPEVEVIGERVKSPNRRVVVRFSDDTRAGVAHWVGTTWLDAALDGAIEAEKGAKAAAERLSVVDERLEQADALNKAFSEKMNDFIVPDETTGTWIVAGEDTGKPFKGADGADGQKIRRLIVDSVAKLPSTGDGGTYYYVVNAKHTATMSVDRPIYLYVEKAEQHPGGSGLFVNGIDVSVGGFVPLSAWVDIINRDYSFAIKAELINTQWLKLTAVYDGVAVSADSPALTMMYLQDYYGYEVYGWVNGRGWVNMEMARDLESLPIATAGTTGVVKFANSVTAADPYNGEVPTGPAIVSYVNNRVSGLASQAELSEYATKAEVADLATKAEVEGLASEDYVDQAVSELGESTYSKAEVNASFLTKTAAAEQYIAHDAGYPRIEVLTRAAFDALPVRDSTVIYFIKKS